MSSNYSRFVKIISLEPAFCLYTATFVIVDNTFTNLLLQKSCRFDRTSEPDLGTTCDDEKQGILFSSEVNSYYRLGKFTFCTLYTILAVSWSDVAGRRRRPIILLPIIGLLFQSLVGCLHTYFWTWDPLKAALSNILCEIISGGVSLMGVICVTYMCDVTDTKTRTMRLGLLSAARTFGDLVGYSSSGFILRSVGFLYTFLLCIAMSLVTLMLAVASVKEVSVPVLRKTHFCQVFNLMRIADSAKVVYKKSLGRNRIVVSMLFVISILVFFTTMGENSVQYLFLRYKFHWDERDYSLYVLYRYIGVILGNIFCSIVLSRILQVHDGLIGMIAGFWDIFAVTGYLFAYENWHLFIIPIFDIFHGTAFTACCSFYSKYYTSDELGRLNSFLGLFAFVIPMCYPAYNVIFQNSLYIFPSAYFILSIAIDVIVVLLYWKSYSLSRKLQNEIPTRREEIPMMT